jgi:fumarylacetoacetase
MLDYEAEVGFFVGQGTERGQTLTVDEAEERIFGLCLVNDWSARDIQSWEYQPLGPFLSKSFATTVSPWVVTREALEPYRVPSFFRPSSDPRPLPYLSSDRDKNEGGVDLNMRFMSRSMLMREGRLRAFPLSAASFADILTPAQMLAHHASNGCNLRPGDLFASGTLSQVLSHNRRGAARWNDQAWGWSDRAPTGEERKFLHDGDEVIMRAFFQRDGAAVSWPRRVLWHRSRIFEALTLLEQPMSMSQNGGEPLYVVRQSPIHGRGVFAAR